MLHEDTVTSLRFSIFISCTSFQHGFWIIQSDKVDTLKQKLDRFEAINFGVHYHALITKYQVGKRTITQIREDYANIRKRADAAGTTTWAKAIS